MFCQQRKRSVHAILRHHFRLHCFQNNDIINRTVSSLNHHLKAIWARIRPTFFLSSVPLVLYLTLYHSSLLHNAQPLKALTLSPFRTKNTPSQPQPHGAVCPPSPPPPPPRLPSTLRQRPARPPHASGALPPAGVRPGGDGPSVRGGLEHAHRPLWDPLRGAAQPGGLWHRGEPPTALWRTGEWRPMSSQKIMEKNHNHVYFSQYWNHDYFWDMKCEFS